MRRRTVLLAGGVAAVIVGAVATGVATSQAATVPPAAVVNPPSVSLAGSPYIYPGFGGKKDPVQVMQQTGVRAFTLAFILNKTDSKGVCQPIWDGGASLTSSGPVNRINAIRNNGGDVVISAGGASGNKLGNACKDEKAL